MKKGKTFRVELRQHQTKDVDADMAHVDASGTLTFSYGIRHPATLFFPSRTTYHPFAWISRGVWINCIEIAE